MRYFFVYRGRATPSGGHKQIRLLVSLLNEIGEDACLLFDGATADDSLYQIETPRAPVGFKAAAEILRPDDVVVFPEVRLVEYFSISADWNCRKAVYIQGGFNALRHCPPGGYAPYGVEFVMTVAPYISALAHTFLGMPCSRIFEITSTVARPPFDPHIFDTGSRPLAISYMPRKLPDHVKAVREMLDKSHPYWGWLPIDGCDENEVARKLRSCRIFLSTQIQEGFGLPALEAMSCGTLVVGYRGTQPFEHPYATAGNGFWARDGSTKAAARQMNRAVRMITSGDDRLERVLANARTTASRFSKEQSVTSLRNMLSIINCGGYARSTHRISDLSLRCHLTARWIMLRARVHQ